MIQAGIWERYKFSKLLGEGSFGKVFLGTDMASVKTGIADDQIFNKHQEGEHKVAIKVLDLNSIK